jgi:Zn-finger nucleic acid-binding protein
MKCPACGSGLEQMTVGGLTVDVCRDGCAGIWFDNFELKKVDEKHESAGAELLALRRNLDVVVDHSLKRECPKCSGQKMAKHFMSVKRQVEVDECPACGGFWLDPGELAKIRDQFQTEEDRKQAASEYFEDVFADDLAKMEEESKEQLERAQSVAKMFRFICPTYYMPGKQGWGAF